MEQLHKLEKTVAMWLKDVPHLPVNVRKWIAENGWWITIVSVAFSGVGILGLLGAIAYFSAFSTIVAGPVLGAALTGTLLISAFVSLILLIVTVILEAMAIKPLKVLDKRGWDLLFLVTIISLVFGLLSALIRTDITGIFSSVLSAAVTSYFLFEIVGYFKVTGRQKIVHKPVISVTK